MGINTTFTNGTNYDAKGEIQSKPRVRFLLPAGGVSSAFLGQNTIQVVAEQTVSDDVGPEIAGDLTAVVVNDTAEALVVSSDAQEPNRRVTIDPGASVTFVAVVSPNQRKLKIDFV